MGDGKGVPAHNTVGAAMCRLCLRFEIEAPVAVPKEGEQSRVHPYLSMGRIGPQA